MREVTKTIVSHKRRGQRSVTRLGINLKQHGFLGFRGVVEFASVTRNGQRLFVVSSGGICAYVRNDSRRRLQWHVLDSFSG